MSTAVLRVSQGRLGLSHLFPTFRQWKTVSAQRRALYRLSNHHLRDIGLARLDPDIGGGFWICETGPDGWRSQL